MSGVCWMGHHLYAAGIVGAFKRVRLRREAPKVVPAE